MDFEIEEKYRWFFNYSLPCTLGNKQKFNELVKKFPSLTDREKVIEYFLGEHNRKTFYETPKSNLVHLVIPYYVLEKKKKINGKIKNPFYDVPKKLEKIEFSDFQIETAKKYQIINGKSDLNGIFLIHSLYIVDKTNETELNKFLKVK